MAHEVERVWQVVLSLAGDEYKSRGDMTEEEARVVAGRMSVALPDAGVEVVRSRARRRFVCAGCGIDTSLGPYLVRGSDPQRVRAYPPHCSDCLLDSMPIEEASFDLLGLLLEHSQTAEERGLVAGEIARRGQA